MFKCERCGLDSAIGETQTKIVIATRKKEYPAFQRVNGTHDRGGVGVEIAQEVAVHERCAPEVHALIAEANAKMAQPVSPVVYETPASSTTPFNGVHVA